MMLRQGPKQYQQMAVTVDQFEAIASRKLNFCIILAGQGGSRFWLCISFSAYFATTLQNGASVSLHIAIPFMTINASIVSNTPWNVADVAPLSTTWTCHMVATADSLRWNATTWTKSCSHYLPLRISLILIMQHDLGVFLTCETLMAATSPFPWAATEATKDRHPSSADHTTSIGQAG
jgi:hypothetical protein